MGHLGEFCAEPEATKVRVGAALPHVRLIIRFWFFVDQKKAEKNARTIQ